MLNLRNWNKKKILFILSDPGSGNIILSLIKRYNLINYNIYLSKKKIKFQGNIKNLTSKSSIHKTSKDKPFDLCVVGTGTNPTYISLANKFKKNKIFTIAILDHWLNFISRFKKKNEKFIPDKIFLTDLKKTPKDLFFKNIKTVKIKNFFIEEKIQEIRKLSKIKYDLLYISDPATYIQSKLIRNEIIDDSIKNLLLYVKQFKKLKVLIRPHPNENLSNLKKNIKRIFLGNKNTKIKINISSEKNISKDIAYSRIITGMQSSAIVLAKKSGKTFFTSMSKDVIKKHKLRKYLKNKAKNLINK